MSKSAEIFIWCLPLMCIVMAIEYVGLVWFRWMVTLGVEIISTIGGLIV